MQDFELRVIAEALTILDMHFKSKGDAFTSPMMVGSFLRLHLEREESEVFAVMFLDSKLRLIEFRRMFFGTIDQATIHPREVVKAALQLNASAVLFSHNHPSGDPTPSHADRQITNRLKSALELVDVRVVDHVVIGHGTYESMADQGWI
jgi:DNA repair protein RadC